MEKSVLLCPHGKILSKSQAGFDTQLKAADAARFGRLSCYASAPFKLFFCILQKRISILEACPNFFDITLRESDSDSSASCGNYYNGCVAALLSDQSNGWIRVCIGSLEGYMEARYLK